MAEQTAVPVEIVERKGKPRQSEPGQWQPYINGGIGILARRQAMDPLSYEGADKVERIARNNPMQLMLDLPALHPSVGLAQWNALRLMVQPGKYGFKAYEIDGKTISKAGQTEVDKLLLPSRQGGALPAEVGSLGGLLNIQMSHLLLTGMAAVEVQPNQVELDSIHRIWPINTLTLGFGRPTEDSDLQPYQRQRWPSSMKVDGNVMNTFQNVISGETMYIGGSYAAYSGNVGWVPLSPERTFWTAIDRGVDDPYGLAPYATALNEVLSDLALMRDLRDAVHNAAWPRLDVGVNLSELHKVAVEIHKITDPKKAAEWVQTRFKEIVEYVQGLAPDDNLVHDSSGAVETKQPGAFDGLEGVLSFLRQRLVQALKSLPTLLGVNDGSTFNYTSVEWAIYAAGLEAVRDIIMEMDAEALTFALQLVGIAAIVKPHCEKIRTNDALTEANTDEIVTRTAAAQEALGYTDHDEAANKAVGHNAVGPALPGVLEGQAKQNNTANKDGGKNDTASGQGNPNAGKAPDEKKK